MRVRVIGIALVAVFAIAALTAGSAFALPEYGSCVAKAGGKYSDGNCTKAAKGGSFEFLKVFPNKGFTDKAGEGVLETVSGNKVICTANTGVGEYKSTTSTKEVQNVVVTFTGCTLPLIGAECHSAGAEAGHIITNPLGGKLGYVSKSAKTVEQELAPMKSVVSKQFAAFECGGGAVKIITAQGTGKGGNCIYGPLSPTNTATGEATQTYAGTGKPGVQNPQSLEGSTKICNLESQANGGTWERATEAVTATITSAEATLEVKA